MRKTFAGCWALAGQTKMQESIAIANATIFVFMGFPSSLRTQSA